MSRNLPQVLMFDDEEILHIDEEGKITLQSGVTAEKLAELLMEAMKQVKFWRERTHREDSWLLR